jgi:hypothetical protein
MNTNELPFEHTSQEMSRTMSVIEFLKAAEAGLLGLYFDAARHEGMLESEYDIGVLTALLAARIEAAETPGRASAVCAAK